MAGKKARGLEHESPVTPPQPTGKSGRSASMVTEGSVEQQYWQDAQSRNTTPAPSPAQSMEGTVPTRKTTVALGGSINNPIFVQEETSKKKGTPKDKCDRSQSATSHQAPGVRNDEKYDKYYHKIFGCKKTILVYIRIVSIPFHADATLKKKRWISILRVLHPCQTQDATLLSPTQRWEHAGFQWVLAHVAHRVWTFSGLDLGSYWFRLNGVRSTR